MNPMKNKCILLKNRETVFFHGTYEWLIRLGTAQLQEYHSLCVHIVICVTVLLGIVQCATQTDAQIIAHFSQSVDMS
jgi:hypothetical protein